MAKVGTITANPRRIDLTGKKFGRWTVISYAGFKKMNPFWLCRCECGKHVEVQRGSLISGRSVSCGCYKDERTAARSRTHGASGYRGKGRGPLYVTWIDMRRRCYTKSFSRYADYGGRGISVCDRWMNGADGKTGYECFVADMGEKPSPKHSLERKDVNGDYEPGNCVWATDDEQARNTRRNRWVTFRGRRMILAEAIKESGLTVAAVASRLSDGWSEERALTQPLRKLKSRRKAS